MSTRTHTLGAWALALLAACGAPAAEAPPAEAPPAEAPPPVAAEAPAAAPAEPQGDEAPAEVEVPAAVDAPAAAEAPKPAGPRLGSLRSITWVYAQPAKDARKIGYVREGTSAPMADDKPVKGTGCAGGWYALAPYGYVCRDGSVTLDLSSPRFQALAAAAPRGDAVMPFRYALSQGAPMYNRVPSLDEQIKAEGPPEKRVKPPPLGGFLSGHEELATDEVIAASDKAPPWKGGAPPDAPASLVRKWIPHGSMLAYSHAFEANGRTWLLSPDLTIVPADRVKPFRVSSFHGVALEGGARLPMAWSRHDAAVKYKRGPDGLVATAERWPPRTPVALAGERVEQGSKVFWQTREPGVYALEGEVVIARARTQMPAPIEPDQRWIDVHIRTGTLVAYAGEKPVFVTLVSPGAGGFGPASASNEALVKQSATPLGVYRITWKTRAAVMTPETGDPQKFWIADVPHTLYFRPPFAIHTAYWHEDFGMYKSAGCINVSPEDGRFLFDWAGPPTPPGWQGSGPGKGPGVGSLLVISP